MRRLVYDCFNAYGICEKTVFTLALANAFKAEARGNYVTQRCVDINSHKKATNFGIHRQEFLKAKG